MTSAMNWLATWASSPGGPDRNLEEHRGGRSTLGTERNTVAMKNSSFPDYFQNTLTCNGRQPFYSYLTVLHFIKVGSSYKEQMAKVKKEIDSSINEES